MSQASQVPDSRIAAAGDDTIRHAADLLSQGRLVAIPTETVYGLAANAWDADAVRCIFHAKNRPATNPLIVHVASVDRLSDAIAWPPDSSIQSQLRAVMDLWPGPFTVVCPRGPKIPDIVTAGMSTVAVRIPSHPVALKLLQRCPFPLAAPSANPSNYVSPTTAEHVAKGFGDSVALIIDGGPCCHGVESTIVAISPSGPTLLRPGGITAEQLRKRFDRLGLPLLEKTESNHSAPAQLAPGMMEKHYSPRTRLVLLDSERPFATTQRVGRIAFRTLSDETTAEYHAVEVLSESGDLSEVAKHLFAAIRRLDELSLDEIHCDVCEETGIGKAIMDRLRRASTE